MTLEKLQMSATAMVEAIHKARWMRWWSSIDMARESLKVSIGRCKREGFGPVVG